MLQGVITREGGRRAAIYVRVSTNGQEGNFSLPTQLESCRKYARDNSFTVVIELQDVESGAVLDRKGMNTLRDMVCAGSLTR
jgi:DNA invertase Pin-like site-specific DNA recombinase